jgi:hypothetical protein
VDGEPAVAAFVKQAFAEYVWGLSISPGSTDAFIESVTYFGERLVARLATPPTDDTPCEHLIPARECRIVGCRGASTDTPEAER